MTLQKRLEGDVGAATPGWAGARAWQDGDQAGEAWGRVLA
jgi:hypothetical protein